MSDQHNDNDAIMDNIDEERVLHVQDEELGLDVDTQVFIELSFEDRTFAVVTPATPELILFKEADEGTLEELEEEEIQALRKEVDHALSSFEVKMESRGDFWYLSAELPEALLSDAELIEIPGEEDEDSDHLIILAELDRGDVSYLLTTSMDPDMYIVEVDGDAGRIVKDQSELERLEKLMEPIIAEMDAEAAALEEALEEGEG